MYKFLHFIIIMLMIALISLINGCSSHRLQFRNSDTNLYDSCWQKINQFSGQQDILNRDLDQQIYQYQEVVEELLVNREKTLRLIGQFDKNQVIPPADLDAMHLRMKAALNIVDRVVKVIDTNQCWQEADSSRMLDLDLIPLEKKLRIKGAILSLSGALMLYDSYQMIVAVANEDARIRRVLNQSDIGYGIQEDQLAAITDEFLSFQNLSSIKEAIVFYEQNRKSIQAGAQVDDDLAYLDLLIQSSHSYAVLRSLSLDDMITGRIGTQDDTIRDNLNALNRSAVNGVSKLFGNAVGVVEVRKGKLYRNKSAASQILKQIQAGDILLEKTPFRLTDKMIPGHWGHAAIWVGNEQELKNLGIWNSSLVKKYRKQIQNQQMIVEALRDGTKMNTLDHFLNIDDLVILRKKNLTDQEKRKIIELTLRQVGKPYDFNYDVETTDKIVCSQLVYLAYTDIDWPTDNVAGRYTISPDNIALKSLDDGELEIILLFSDGKPITKDISTFMGKLMQQ